MSALEVLQTCPSQKKALLQSLGTIDHVDSQLMTFNLDKSELCLPPVIAFHISVTIHNLIIHRCIIYEDAFTCIMSTNVWKNLESPELIPSNISRRAYDGHPSQPQGLFQNVPIELGGNKVDIESEVIDAPLNYNILLGHIYMNVINVLASYDFCLMVFSHEGKVLTIDHIAYYKHRSS